MLETKDLSHRTVEAQESPPQPSFFPRQTGPARFDALW